MKGEIQGENGQNSETERVSSTVAINLYNNWDLPGELTPKRHYVRRWNFASRPMSYTWPC